MKRLTTTLVLLAGFANLALAHPLPGDEGLVTQLGHQLLSLHHLPLTLLAITAGIMLFRRWKSRERSK